ncbi:predicted protein [Sclerotinia sclerotiorum 1980 UF-70]|uniref:Uncharacterized protein n=1 Tax=Sclerotinia sclerotiorum (strain ATCC 18683 / 1980 / Ss-1) TaxID=665079 RepID=A7F589_SCLS1|nr:predicted protein [Sclerotinia sclerotiorum 1980 UF-70]EDN97910.1 predicted protein [Sclerotinia sclerotiorum 1980 UF-70]
MAYDPAMPWILWKSWQTLTDGAISSKSDCLCAAP